MDIFVSVFSETFLAVLRVFLIVVAAGLLVRVKIITQIHITALTAATVRVFLPCLIFSNIVLTFEPSEFPFWWFLPVSAIVMILLSLLVAVGLFLPRPGAKKNMLALASIQNAGYLILPIGSVLYPDQFDQFALYCFLFILGLSPVLWSFGKYLTTSQKKERLSWKGLMTPPFVANILGLVFVFTGIRHIFTNEDWKIPQAVIQSVDLLGSATVPVAMFILGATLGSITFRIRPYLFDALRVLLVKLFGAPAIIIGILYAFRLCGSYPLLDDFFVLQAASPPATGLILLVRNYGGDEQKISSIMLVSYALCILIMPLWLAIWQSI